MKVIRESEKAPPSPLFFYKSYFCNDCQKTTEKAKILWEQFVSESCVIMRIECSKCSKQKAPLVYKDEYTTHIVGGKYFKNTP